jgi:hypothetical protein
MFANPLDPQGLTSGIQQSTLAQLAGYGGDTQKALTKSLFSSGKPVDMQAAMYYPDAPQLKFDTNATGIGTGIMQGLGNAVNNYQTIKNYRTRTEMLNNAVLEQRQREQQQQDMLAKQDRANMERRATAGLQLPESVREIYNNASPEAQDKIYEQYGAGRVTNALKPEDGAAEGAKAIAEWQALRQQVAQIGELEIKDPKTGEMIPNPTAVRAYSELMKKNPYLTLDAEQDLIKTRRADAQLEFEENKVAAQPGKLAREAQHDALALKKAQVEADYAEAEKAIDIALGQGRVEEAKAARENLTAGRPVYEQFLSTYDKRSPGEIQLFNSRMESMKLPYRLPKKPETVYKATTKDGMVRELYDPRTGLVIQPKRQK